MGDAQGKSGVESFTVFLDENHSGNCWLHQALEESQIPYERHLDHFPRGAEDTFWIPQVAARGWVVLTSDARIRYNALEKRAVRENSLRLFYFTRNDIAGEAMGTSLRQALRRMRLLFETQSAPFIASISRSGDVILRESFDNPAESM